MEYPDRPLYDAPMRIAFVTTDWERVREEDQDRPLHDRAWAAAGGKIEHVPWWDVEADWAAYDLVVLRSPWDYSERLDEFLAWLDCVDGRTRLHNPPPVIRWNLDKRYLLDLGAAGVPVIDTAFLGEETGVAAALAERGNSEVVVKPNISAGSRNTGRFAADDPQALELARTILAENRLVMLQPCAGSVAAIGEVSLVFFDGRLSHAFRKGPILAAGGGLLGGDYREIITPVAATAEQLAVATAASAATERWCRDQLGLDVPLLYGRFDLVRLDDGSEALLEAELFEPSFFLWVDPDAAGRFREAALARALLSTNQQR